MRKQYQSNINKDHIIVSEPGLEKWVHAKYIVLGTICYTNMVARVQ